MRKLAIACLLMTAAGPALGADPDGNFALRGAGAQPCSAYIEQVDGDGSDTVLYLSWLQGYLTFANRATEDTFDSLPIIAPNALVGLLYRVCQNEPDSLVETAAARIVRSFQPLRIVAETPIVTLRAGENTVQVRAGLVRTVQQFLAGAGFYELPVDGQFGPGTARALAAYQASEGLTQTGLPDPNTIVRILADIVTD